MIDPILKKTSSPEIPRNSVKPSGTRRPLGLLSGSFALLLSGLWAGNPVATKAGLEEIGPLRLGWIRFILGGVIVLLWAISSRQHLRVERHEWIPIFLLGSLFSVQIAFMNIGQKLTTAGHASVVITSFPLWAGLFAHFFVPGDRMSKERVFGTVVAYVGVLAVFGRSLTDADDFLLGDILLLISAILLGARQVYISQVAQGIAQHKLLLSQTVFGTSSFLVASLVFESSEAWNITGRLILALAYTGLLIAGFAFIGQVWLLKNYLPSRVTAISISQPVLGVFLSWIILGEAIGPELYVGASLVVLGSWMVQKNPRT